MILVAGGTGTLGSEVVGALVSAGESVRVLTRHADRAGRLPVGEIEVVVGDVRSAADVAAAMRDVTTVISAIQGFAGVEPNGATAVDLDGNKHLLQSATREGVRRFVLISAAGADPASSLGLRRIKYQAEQAVRSGSIPWTIIRPTVYMETWLHLLGTMYTAKKTVTLFGRGDNPINFVSVRDVAAVIVATLSTEKWVGRVLEIGGPEDITLNAVAAGVLAHQGAAHQGAAHPQGSHHHGDISGAVTHVPRIILRMLSTALKPVKPDVAAMAQFGLVMDTSDMTLPMDAARAELPALPQTRFSELLAGAVATVRVADQRADQADR